MTSFNPLSIFIDARRVTRGTPEMLADRQQKRLNELVKFARTYSPFYADKYRGLPDPITDVRQLPSITKVELMEHFDEVVSDPAVRKVEVSDYIADLDNIGKPYLSKYMVWTTSGTTGTPGIFLEDKNWDAVITAINVLRMGGEWYTGDVIRGMIKAVATAHLSLPGTATFWA